MALLSRNGLSKWSSDVSVTDSANGVTSSIFILANPAYKCCDCG
jgi:hypothetical protein